MINAEFTEFVTFAKYMSISKASEALFISQSSLSKHLNKLESDLGFELTYKQGNQLLLTDEGAHFLRGIQSIITDYECLVDECQQIKNHTFPRVVLQDPPFADNASTALFKIADELHHKMRPVKIDFIHEKFKDLLPLLMRGEAHVLLEYHCNAPEVIKEYYRERGVLSYCIAQEPLVVWGKAFLFDDVQTFNPELLRTLAITLSCDASSPTVGLVNELNQVLGFTPKVCYSAARSAPEHFRSAPKNGVFILPKSAADLDSFLSRKGMVSVPFDESLAQSRAYALVSSDCKYLDVLQPLLESAEAATL